MKKFVNINEGHTGSLLNQGQDRRDTGEKKTHMVLSDNEMCFVHLSRLCLNLAIVLLKMFCIHLYLWSLCLSVDTFTSQQQNTSSKALPFHSRLPVNHLQA